MLSALLALLMVGVFGGARTITVVTYASVVLLAAALVIVLIVPTSGATFNGAFVFDPFARMMKVLVLIGSGVAIVMSAGFAHAQKFERFEYPVLIVIATLGMMMMISANDLIAVYLGLELQSLALYVVAAINRDSVRSTEAGLKYFVLGALSSGMLLYGASLVYGFTGQTTFAGIAAALQGGASVGLVFGLVFLIAGFAFKVSAVPFHMWTPDVYEGAPTPVTAFFAAAPKVAAMALFIRALVSPFATITHDWQQVITFIAIASMVLGAFAAIGQRNIKRLMAYSSIGHMGYALVGLAAGTQAGVQGVIIYMLIYMAMTLGTFACILAMRRGESMVENIDDLSGLSRTNPMMAFMLAMLLFSLAGIPPLAGFFAKFYVFLRGDPVRPLCPVGDRCPRQCGGRLLLFAHREDHVFRRAGRRRSRRCRSNCVWCSASAAPSSCSSSSSPARSGLPQSLPQRPSSRSMEAALPGGYRREEHDSLPSTNARALAAARAGEPSGLWVTAGEQTAGRGRRGRAWSTGRGNLAASLLLIDPAPPEIAAALSFVTSVALHQAVVDVAGPAVAERLALKWPNDLLLEGLKVAGILIEGEKLPAGPLAVAIGIGVNCVSHPEVAGGHAAGDLSAQGFPVDAEALFGRVALRMSEELTRWDCGRSFADIREAWLTRATGLGQPIRVNLATRTVEGRFETMDQAGRLVLVHKDGRRETLGAGDVFLMATS